MRKAGLLEDETGLHVIPLSLLLVNNLGPNYLNWTSEALRSECEERWGTLGVITWERIQAVRILQLHDAFWLEWEVFEKITAAILGEAPIFSLVQPPEADEIAIALSVAAKIEKNDYSEDVRGYITAACMSDGLWYYEDPIASAVGNAPLEFDKKMNIVRREKEVAEELAKSDKLRKAPETAVDVQVNRVLGVRLAVQLYHAASDAQLKLLPTASKGK